MVCYAESKKNNTKLIASKTELSDLFCFLIIKGIHSMYFLKIEKRSENARDIKNSLSLIKKKREPERAVTVQI